MAAEGAQDEEGDYTAYRRVDTSWPTIRSSSVRKPSMSPPVSSRSSKVILVVEDEIELSRLFIEVLSDAGYTVVPAYSVTDALFAIADQPFDAAILDVELRDGAVFPVADRLARIGTPYMFASAVYLQAIPTAHKAIPFIAKPFEIASLLSEVEKAISLHRKAG